MKRAVRFLVMNILTFAVITVLAQSKIDEERMQRDIEIAENILQTLLRQEFDKRNFFPYEVRGSYMPGYGVTFRLPGDLNNMGFMMNNEPNIVYNYGKNGSYSYSISSSEGSAVIVSSDEDCEDCEKERARERSKVATNPKRAIAPKARRSYTDSNDSLRTVYNLKIIDWPKLF